MPDAPMKSLHELVPDDQREALSEARATHLGLDMALVCLRDAEAVLADVEANPVDGETPERWRRAHGEVVRCREELHRLQGHALMLRAEYERRNRFNAWEPNAPA